MLTKTFRKPDHSLKIRTIFSSSSIQVKRKEWYFSPSTTCISRGLLCLCTISVSSTWHINISLLHILHTVNVSYSAFLRLHTRFLLLCRNPCGIKLDKGVLDPFSFLWSVWFLEYWWDTLSRIKSLVECRKSLNLCSFVQSL